MSTQLADRITDEGGTELAKKILGLSAPAVYGCVERGELACRRDHSGRRIFRVSDLEALAASRASRQFKR